MERLPEKVERVRHELRKLGIDAEIVMLPESAHTAAQAAQAIGCDVARIVKSLVFRTNTGRMALVLASGKNRVDEAEVERLIGEWVEKADADFVLERTGYAIGGVPPVANDGETYVVMDEELIAFDEVWAAGGVPQAVFKVNPRELAEATGAMVARIANER